MKKSLLTLTIILTGIGLIYAKVLEVKKLTADIYIHEEGYSNLIEKQHLPVPDAVTFINKNDFLYAGKTHHSTPFEDFKYNDGHLFFRTPGKASFKSMYPEMIAALIKIKEAILTKKEVSSKPLKKYGWIVLLFLPVFYFWWFRNKYGKNKKVTTITSYFPPDGIDSAMAGFLINNKGNTENLVSFIPKWGSEGLITIKDLPKKGWIGKADMKLKKLKDISENAPSYEKTIFHGLFSGSKKKSPSALLKLIKKAENSPSFNDFMKKSTEENEFEEYPTIFISDLKNHFYRVMNHAKSQLKKESKIFYDEKAVQQKNKLMLISFFLLFATPLLFFYIFDLFAAISCFVVFLFLIILECSMYKRNEKGDNAFTELKGFRNFIQSADTQRIKTLIETDPTYFEKTLSFAFTFGLLKEWISKFDALEVEPPQWYTTGDVVGIASMSNFVHTFSDQMSAMKSTMASLPYTSHSSSSISSSR